MIEALKTRLDELEKAHAITLYENEVYKDNTQYIAQKKSLRNAFNKGNTLKIKNKPNLKKYIYEKLDLDWSPEEIS